MRDNLVQPQGSTGTVVSRETIAKVFGVDESEVGTLIITNDTTGLKILFDEENNSLWWNTGSGTLLSYKVENGINYLMTSTGTFLLYPATGQFTNDGTISPDTQLSLSERNGKKGQFDIIPSPWDKRAIVGQTFGGDKNSATILVDERGKISTEVFKDGVRTNKGMMFATVENMGIVSGPDSKEVKIVRFPSDGFEDEDNSPGIFITFDTSGSPILHVLNPQQFGESGYPNPNDEGLSYNTLISKTDLKNALSGLFNDNSKYFTYRLPGADNSISTWVKVATFTTATGTGNPNGNFKVIVTSSGNKFPNGRSYLISGNSRGLSSVSLSNSNVDTYFNITALENKGKDDDSNQDWILSAGVTQSGNTVTLYLKLPFYSAYSTITAMNIGYNGYVNYDPSNLTAISAEPTGILYLTAIYPYNTSNVTVSSDGTLMEASPIVRIATGEKNTDRSDITDQNFIWSGSGTINKKVINSVVTHVSTGVYHVTNAILATDGWYVRAPRSVSGGDDLAIVECTNDSTGVTVNVYQRNLVVADNKVTVAKGDLIDVPMDSWVDLRILNSGNS